MSTKKKKNGVEKVLNNLKKAHSAKPGGGGKFLSKAAKYAKPAVSLGLDGVSTVFPFLKGPREVLRAVTGFDERRVSPPSDMSAGGGTVVQTMNAPVQFARNTIQTGWQTYGKTDGGELWSFTDMAKVGGATFPLATAAANTFSQINMGINPTSKLLFPNYYIEATIWERWRPLKIIVHYCHFAPTSSQSAIGIAINEDPTEGTPLNISGLMALENSTQGSCYEDFALACTPTPWKQGEWMYIDTTSTGAEVSALRQTYAGAVHVATDANVQVNTAVGYIYCELLFEVSGKRVPNPALAMTEDLIRTVREAPIDKRKAYVAWVLSALGAKVLDDVEGLQPPSHKYFLEDELVSKFLKECAITGNDTASAATPTPTIRMPPLSTTRLR